MLKNKYKTNFLIYKISLFFRKNLFNFVAVPNKQMKLQKVPKNVEI